MASTCRQLRPQLPTWLLALLIPLLLLLLATVNQSHALEFMEADESAPDPDNAEIPPSCRRHFTAIRETPLPISIRTNKMHISERSGSECLCKSRR